MSARPVDRALEEWAVCAMRVFVVLLWMGVLVVVGFIGMALLAGLAASKSAPQEASAAATAAAWCIIVYVGARALDRIATVIRDVNADPDPPRRQMLPEAAKATEEKTPPPTLARVSIAVLVIGGFLFAAWLASQPG